MMVYFGTGFYQYTSDFDITDIESNVRRNWKISAGDYFNFPVIIGPYPCFLKRFDKKKEDISGFELLNIIKGRRIRGLPFLYDVVLVEEGGREVFYTFYEYLLGDTIENLQKQDGFDFYPEKLAEDLYFALQSLHENGYWFSDFDPKNLFKSSSGDFYIIDLDSTYPISELPSSKMFGSKEYWTPVQDFYKIQKAYTVDELKLMRGDTLNILQLVYLMSVYSYYLFAGGQDLTADTLKKLNDYFTKKYALFTSSMQYCFYRDPATRNIHQRPMPYKVFMSLINNCLFTNSKEQQRIARQMAKPAVQFIVKGNKSRVNEGEKYVLEWKTRQATTVVLDNVKEELSGRKEVVALKNVTHTLRALSECGKATEAEISLSVYLVPKINLSVTPSKITANQIVTIKWMVSNATNIVLLQDGKVIRDNCIDSDSISLALKISERSSKFQTYRFLVQAKNSSTQNTVNSDESAVMVERKRGIYLWLIIASIAVILIILSILFYAHN